MTRPSRREIEHALDDLGDGDDTGAIRFEETIVGTEWSPDESDGDEVLGPGETRTETWRVGGGEGR